WKIIILSHAVQTIDINIVLFGSQLMDGFIIQINMIVIHDHLYGIQSGYAPKLLVDFPVKMPPHIIGQALPSFVMELGGVGDHAIQIKNESLDHALFIYKAQRNGENC